MNKHTKLFYSVFHEKLKQLLEQADKLISAAKEKKPYNEGLVCLLSETIYELEKASDKIIQDGDNEELSIDAQLVQNVLQEPVFPKHQPHKQLSLLKAARYHKETQDTSEIKEIILACVLDKEHTEVMIENLTDIYHSIDMEMKKGD